MSNDFKRYLVSYRYDGAEWNIELPASSAEDARQRLGQIMFARVDGEIVAQIPAAFGPIAALAAWAGNLFGRAGRAV